MEGQDKYQVVIPMQAGQEEKGKVRSFHLIKLPRVEELLHLRSAGRPGAIPQQLLSHPKQAEIFQHTPKGSHRRLQMLQRLHRLNVRILIVQFL